MVILMSFVSKESQLGNLASPLHPPIQSSLRLGWDWRSSSDFSSSSPLSASHSKTNDLKCRFSFKLAATNFSFAFFTNPKFSILSCPLKLLSSLNSLRSAPLWDPSLSTTNALNVSSEVSFPIPRGI
ncbi:hypothetical protein V6Z12_A11G376300 [Gossypium hirsutum]